MNDTIKCIDAALRILVILFLAAPPDAEGQACAPVLLPHRESDRQTGLRTAGPSANASESSRIVREIDDPQTKMRWLLLDDPDHPGGPGRMVADSRRDFLPTDSKPRKAGSERLPGLPPLIRPGDRLLVEENTAVAHAVLEAVALGPAAVGSGIQVRFKIGGRVACGVAMSPRTVALVSPGVTK